MGLVLNVHVRGGGGGAFGGFASLGGGLTKTGTDFIPVWVQVF